MADFRAARSHLMGNLRTAIIIGINVAGVVGIVVLVKQLFTGYSFKFPIFLLMLHQASTALALQAACMAGMGSYWSGSMGKVRGAPSRVTAEQACQRWFGTSMKTNPWLICLSTMSVSVTHFGA